MMLPLLNVPNSGARHRFWRDVDWLDPVAHVEIVGTVTLGFQGCLSCWDSSFGKDRPRTRPFRPRGPMPWTDWGGRLRSLDTPEHVAKLGKILGRRSARVN